MSKTALRLFGFWCFCLCLAGPAAALGADVLVWFKGETLPSQTTGQEAPPGIGTVYDWLWPRVMRDYIVSRGLQALPEEVEAVRRYDGQFRAQDRAQRARKAAELEERLAQPALADDEQAWLRDFLTTLRRLEAADLMEDAAGGPEADPNNERRVAIIEHWKSSESLYREFGGVVALLPFGPYPHGARVALLETLEASGELILAPEVRGAFYMPLQAAPAQIVSPDRVDFTPYWQRPIPPSYFAD